KVSLRERVVMFVVFAQIPQPPLVCRPGVDIPRRLADGPLLLGLGDGWGNSDGDRLGDLVLYRENASEVAIVAFGPDVLAGLRLDQLRRHPDTLAGFAKAAFEDIANA